MKHVVLTALLLVTLGCTSPGPTHAEYDQLLVGYDIHSVISRIGVPDEETEVAGYTSYTWRSQQIVASHNYAPDFQSYETQSISASCVLRLTMDQEIVMRAYWQGHGQVCQYYRDRL